MRTASPRARCRSKCSLSSREVKSTGVKFFVVIFPSTVIAKVTATKGRFGRRRDASPRCLSERDGGVASTSFFLGDFMLERDELFFHLAHFHVARLAARFVEEINDPARQTAQQDDRESREPDHPRDGRRDGAKIE